MSALAEPGFHEGLEVVQAEEVVRLDRVSRVFRSAAGRVVALHEVDLSVRRGEVVCLVGASGCGKSTLLSLVAGLDAPTSGRVSVADGRPALMFQDAALLPWLTARENVAFPMRLAGRRRAERGAEADRLLAMVRLEAAAEQRPHELSGGMRQRVALARALAQRTEVLLMDEPFGALDAITRGLLHEDVMRVRRETGVTILFVTHDVREAVTLADRVVLLGSRPGRVVDEWGVSGAQGERSAAAVAELSADITARLRDEIAAHVGR